MITIHMTTYRRHASGLLARAIESVLSQDFRDFEFVICDDASTDGTAIYLDRMAAFDRRVRIIRNPRNVNSVAISLGRCMSASATCHRWVSWMFDDCVLLPGALSRLVDAAKRSSAGVIYGVTEVVQSGGRILRVGDQPLEEVRHHIRGSSVLVPNGGILVDRDVFERIGWYDPSVVLRRSCDWDLFCRMIEGGVHFETIPSLVMHEFGETQSDSLRNAFTTTFDLMARFVRARDAAGTTLSLANALIMPVDWIPPAAWSPQELSLMRYMFMEYFLSIGDIPSAFRWARLVDPELENDALLRSNLLTASTQTTTDGWMAAGAYAATVFSAYRRVLQEQLGYQR